MAMAGANFSFSLFKLKETTLRFPTWRNTYFTSTTTATTLCSSRNHFKRNSSNKEIEVVPQKKRLKDDNDKAGSRSRPTVFKSSSGKEKKGFLYDLKESQVDSENLQDVTFLNAVVKVYCTHTAPDYSLPWQKQRQFTSTGSAFMIGDGKLLTNAHCVEHDTQVNLIYTYKKNYDPKRAIC